MDSKRKEITPDVKKIMKESKEWSEDKTLWKIGKLEGLILPTRVINNYKLSKSVISKIRCGHPSKLTFREKRYIPKSVHINPRITASQIVNDIQGRFLKTLHEDTIRKILKKVHYHGHVVSKKEHIVNKMV